MTDTDGSLQREVLVAYGGPLHGGDVEFRVERWTLMVDAPIESVRRVVLVWDKVDGDDEYAVLLSPEKARAVAKLLIAG